MFPIAKLAFRRINDIPAGHLIYVPRDTGFELALRVEHPPLGAIEDVFPAAIVFFDMAGSERMPMIDISLRNSRCIDWGTQPQVRWKPGSILSRNRLSVPALKDPGYLVVISNADTPVAITAYSKGGRGERQYWDLKTGKFTEPGADDFCVVSEWQLGACDADGRFVPLVSYPDDYTKV